eukprot:TRINITY_DN22084_c0_g1_i2.p1 TRINITY_DN22084_c0_g1~~TRINITY_DN22084_c0_g1_i2.p1  ORF type:complete len:407 (+),score=108.65 TRINITY_DN22084_c0_g1_i2:67-1287(+)
MVARSGLSAGPLAWRELALGAAAGAGLSATAMLALLRRYLRLELRRPDLIHAPVEERELEDRHLLQEVKLLLREYWPHPILEFSGYISTIWSCFWAVLPAQHCAGTLEPLRLRDGGTVSLHWGDAPTMPPLAAGGAERIAVLFPGLNNDSKTSFIQATMRHLREGGFRAVTLNYRGTGGLELTSPRLGCGDSWQDVPEVVEHILRRYPGAQLFAVGFSLGGGMLMKHLGEEGAKTRFRAAVTIAGAIDFPRVVASLESSLKKRSVNFCMVNGVKLFMLHSLVRSPFAAGLDRWRILRACSLRQIDEATICVLHGYRDAEDYYSSNNPRPTLARVAIPTLVVNAEDDPVVGVGTLPVAEMRRNPHIYLTITRRGGHIGWGSGGLGAAAWTDYMAVDFLQACGLRSKL